MTFNVYPLEKTRREDFFHVHSDTCEMKGCFCTAWWVPTWEEWENRTYEQNRALREELFEQGVFDGYLLYADDRPIGWCQCGPRDHIPKIRQTYNLLSDNDVWAVSCIYLHPDFREIGMAHYFFGKIIEDIKSKGIKYIQGFPRRCQNAEPKDIWTGPVSLFEKAGFVLERDDEHHPVYGLKLIGE